MNRKKEIRFSFNSQKVEYRNAKRRTGPTARTVAVLSGRTSPGTNADSPKFQGALFLPTIVRKWEKPISVWDASHNVGLRSHYVAAALSVPHMLKNNHGLIINISSSGGKGYLFDIAYGSVRSCVPQRTGSNVDSSTTHSCHSRNR